MEVIVLNVDERLRANCERVQNLANDLVVESLLTLDFGDRMLVEKKLRRVINSLQYILAVDDTRCSVVVEAIEQMG